MKFQQAKVKSDNNTLLKLVVASDSLKIDAEGWELDVDGSVVVGIKEGGIADEPVELIY